MADAYPVSFFIRRVIFYDLGKGRLFFDNTAHILLDSFLNQTYSFLIKIF